MPVKILNAVRYLIRLTHITYIEEMLKGRKLQTM